MMLRCLSALLLGLAIAACSGAATPAPSPEGVAPRGLGWGDVVRLVASRDFFSLRDRLANTGAAASPPERLARAVVDHAFNDPTASNEAIAELLALRAIPDSVAAAMRQLRMSNHLRLFEYAAGLAATDSLLAHPAGLDSAELHDARNMRRTFAALAGVPRQTSEARGPTALRFQNGRVPVQVNDSLRHYVFDTGANLSTIMRSEAEALGLRMIPAGIEVGTATGMTVVADLAVADRLAIGRMHYRHVVFLVLDDELLTFPGGFRIPGIIGFPVIERMGEVHLGAVGDLFVPAETPRRPQRNLALDELTLLTRVRWNDVPLLCQLDTGADRTRMYEPFYRKARARVDSVARPATRRIGGAGGIRELPVRVLPNAALALGDTVVVLDSVDVLPQSIASSESENHLDCNIGHDVLDAFSGYVINFRDMAFLLH